MAIKRITQSQQDNLIYLSKKKSKKYHQTFWISQFQHITLNRRASEKMDKHFRLVVKELGKDVMIVVLVVFGVLAIVTKNWNSEGNGIQGKVLNRSHNDSAEKKKTCGKCWPTEEIYYHKFPSIREELQHL